MAKRDRSLEGRSIMYEQQIAHLPDNKSFEEIYDYIEQNLKPVMIAGIIHDKDKKEDGKTPVEEHIHIMMRFKNSRSLKQIAKDIGDKPQQLEKWNGNYENGFSYLIHATEGARYKHQYSCDEVKANFDYTKKIQEISKKVSKASGIGKTKAINEMLDNVAVGAITLKEAKNRLSGSDYAKSGDRLKKAHELYLERNAEKFYQEMKDNNEMVYVHWFYGGTETGKSFLAEKTAKEDGMYYKTTTTKDPFQFYQSEPVIILDELRPENIPFSELLAMFNPFSRGKVVVSSRYYNKALACRTFYITTPFDPVSFCLKYGLNNIDKGDQLYRRLSTVMKFDMDYIYKMEYSQKDRYYIEVDKMENKYSKKNLEAYKLDNIFDRLKGGIDR